MPLSQLLITLDSFQSLPLAGATLLKRARIWAESDMGGSRLGGVCRPLGAPSPAVPSLVEERCPRETWACWRAVTAKCSVWSNPRWPPLGLVSPLVGSGLGFGAQCSAPGHGGGHPAPASQLSCTPRALVPCFGISLSLLSRVGLC